MPIRLTFTLKASVEAGSFTAVESGNCGDIEPDTTPSRFPKRRKMPSVFCSCANTDPDLLAQGLIVILRVEVVWWGAVRSCAHVSVTISKRVDFYRRPQTTFRTRSYIRSNFVSSGATA